MDESISVSNVLGSDDSDDDDEQRQRVKRWHSYTGPDTSLRKYPIKFSLRLNDRGQRTASICRRGTGGILQAIIKVCTPLLALSSSFMVFLVLEVLVGLIVGSWFDGGMQWMGDNDLG